MAKSEEEKEATKKSLKKKKAEKLNKEFVILVIGIIALFLVYEFGFMHPALWNTLVTKFFAPIFKNFGIILK